MNKAELTEAMLSKCKAGDFPSHAAAERAVDAIFASMREALTSGDDVAVTGFGTLVPVDKAARRLRNPRTGEFMDVPEKRGVRFRASSKLFG